MRATRQKELEAVLRLDGPSRYAHFVKRVADDQAVWALWKDGWALMTRNDGVQVFPFWPAREYAELCRVGEWNEYLTEEISLDDLLNELLPKLETRGVLAGVFPTAEGQGVTVPPADLATSLREELRRYE